MLAVGPKTHLCVHIDRRKTEDEETMKGSLIDPELGECVWGEEDVWIAQL